MSIDRIARMLLQRPPRGRYREQLFWLVDIIYACKTSGNERLAASAAVVEDALSRLGDYLETGDMRALDDAAAHVEQFARTVKATVAALQEEKE